MCDERRRSKSYYDDHLGSSIRQCFLHVVFVLHSSLHTQLSQESLDDYVRTTPDRIAITLFSCRFRARIIVVLTQRNTICRTHAIRNRHIVTRHQRNLHCCLVFVSLLDIIVARCVDTLLKRNALINYLIRDTVSTRVSSELLITDLIFYGLRVIKRFLISSFRYLV